MDIRMQEIVADLGTKGVLLRISKPGGGAVGRLRIGKAKLTWARGSTSKNVTEIRMDEFIDWLNSQE